MKNVLTALGHFLSQALGAPFNYTATLPAYAFDAGPVPARRLKR